MTVEEKPKPYLHAKIIAEASHGAVFNVEVDSKTTVHALMDTGAAVSCMSRMCYERLSPLPPLQELLRCNLVAASGNSLQPLGKITIPIKIGDKKTTQQVIVCDRLQRSFILGRDFQQQNGVEMGWNSKGKMQITFPAANAIPIDAIDGTEEIVSVQTQVSVKLPARHVVTISVAPCGDCVPLKGLTDFRLNKALEIEYPGLTYIPLLSDNSQQLVDTPLLVPLINLTDKAIHLPKNTHVGDMFVTSLEEIDTEFNDAQFLSVDEIQLCDPLSKHENAFDKHRPIVPERVTSDFLTSPADVNPLPKVKLEDANVSSATTKSFEDLKEKFQDVFSKGSADIGRTHLIEMDVDTGDSPPVCQKPYSLPLKHYDWVRKELQLLEQAGVIVKSVSPWASPIVVVPKKGAPGEAPRRRLCVDYRAVNNLLPDVLKVGSKAKGVVTLFPLPKIDEMYAHLHGATVFSTLDLRSGYHHIALSPSSRAKSAFVTPMGKYEFLMVPFGLSQAPAYFQRLIAEVLTGCESFAQGYLDDILIFSKTHEEHLQHLEIIFERLRQAGLKLKGEKCQFFKKNLHYLGHVISEEGIKPLPDKIQAIQDMPHPTNLVEVQQLMGLMNYYRKFIPCYSDLARPIIELTHGKTSPKDKIDWTELAQSCFDQLKEKFLSAPVLRYPDVNKPYFLFTDASNYAWAGVLTQAEESCSASGRVTTKYMPISFVSGLFRGSQRNWAALTKEAYAIYQSVRKLAMYLTLAKTTIRSDHLPLKNFLQKNTLNNKVNRWAVELEEFQLEFDFIEGRRNVLADTLSRLIKLDPSVAQSPEPPTEEFGCTVFDEQTVNLQINSIDPDNWEDSAELSLGKRKEKVFELQQQDPFCQKVSRTVKGTAGPFFFDDDKLLRRRHVEHGQEFHTLVAPRKLVPLLLKLAHDNLGHNGAIRTYHALKRHFFWPRMSREVKLHVAQCYACLQKNKQSIPMIPLNFKVPKLPMQFLSMDLIGPMPVSTRGNCYALTAVCMLTSFAFCVPLPNKEAETVCSAYLNNIAHLFGHPLKILTDNGTEFKNQHFLNITKQHGIQHVFAPAYHPSSNGKIENLHYFLKACMTKYVQGYSDWDDTVSAACSAYNYFPQEGTKETPFFLMFARDPWTPLNTFLEPQSRYMGTDKVQHDLQLIRHVYWVAAENLNRKHVAQAAGDGSLPVTFSMGDLLLIRDHTAGGLDNKYPRTARVIDMQGQTRVLIEEPDGKQRVIHVKDAKRVQTPDILLQQLPDLSSFGRRARWSLDPTKLPDIPPH